ncbi:MAG: glycosyltransferase [Bacteroidia bacterium]|nr:glycosyltransferase [Bacteroidia bacterium]MCX7651863.1 glycosyltransferase [Bacteroidia bacterium]MDW8415987.1 glycosyltransferase family 2 protein [Bacteroidia bacterium]
MPRLSIITVTYQAAQVLPITLRSVKIQSWRDWEHIFVDGNSTDETLTLIREYERTVPLVRWISEKDRGIYDAMNKGLRLATGEYVTFLNAGDAFWESDTLEKLFENAPTGAQVLYGDHRYVDLHGQLLPRRRPRPYPSGELKLAHFRTGMAIAHQGLFVKREIAPEYDLSYPLAADLDWAIRLMKRKPSTYDSGQILIRYLEGGVSARRLRRYIQERTRILYKHFGWSAVLESFYAMMRHKLRGGYPFVE